MTSFKIPGSFVLCMAFCLALGVFAYSPVSYATSSEEHFSEYFGNENPDNEVYRSSHSRHFKQADGSTVAYISVGPMHYMGTDGKWHLYDLTPNGTNAVGYAYSVEDNNLQTFYPATSSGWVKSGNLEGYFLRWKEHSMAYFAPDGEMTVLQYANNSLATISGERLYYDGLYSGVNAEYMNGNGALKHNYILPSMPSFLSSYSDGYVGFGVELELDPRLSLYAGSSQVTGYCEYAGKLVLKLATGDSVLIIPAPMAGEVGIVRDGASSDLSFQFQFVGDKLVMYTKVPVSYLKSGDRLYPVYVDPTLQLTASQTPTNVNEQGYTFNAYYNGATWGQIQYGPVVTPPKNCLGVFVGCFATGANPSRSLIEWKTTSINDYAQVTKVEVRLFESYNWSYAGTGQTCDSFAISNNFFADPYNIDILDTTASVMPSPNYYPALYTDMADGDQYLTNVISSFSANTWYPGSSSWQDLGTAAAANCEGDLPEAYFGMSVATRTSSRTTQSLATIAAYNDTVTGSRNLLRVTFTDARSLTIDSTYSTALISIDGNILPSLPATVSVSYGFRNFAAEQYIAIVENQERFRFDHWSTGSTDPSAIIFVDKNFDFASPLVANYVHEYYLDIVSQEGNVAGDPSGWYAAGANINTYISGAAGQTLDSRRSVSGWLGEGSAPSSGTTMIVPQFALTQFSRITWNWDIQYRLSAQGALSPYIGPPPGWYFRNQLMVGVGVFPYVQTDVNNRKYAIGWTAQGALGDGSGNVIPDWNMSKPTIITWIYEIRYELVINSAHGGIVGNQADYFAPGSEVNTGVSRYVIDPLDSSTRYEARSWTATGSLTDGLGYEIPTFSITVPTTITWNWTTQYMLTISTLFGTVSPANGTWFDTGTEVTISATAPPNNSVQDFSWVGWDGSGNGSVSAGSPAESITMDSPITEIATWYAEFYLTLDPGPGGFVDDVSGWYPYGTVVLVQATPPPPVFDNRFLLGWDGTGTGVVKVAPQLGNENIVSVSILDATVQQAIWITQYRVRIRNSQIFGDPRPPVGDYWVTKGELFYGSVMPNVRGQICTGFIGSGSVPSGTLPIFSANIEAPSSVTWQWAEATPLPLKQWNAPVTIAEGFRGRNVISQISPDGTVFAVAYYSQETQEIRCNILLQGHWNSYVLAEGDNLGTFMDMVLDENNNPHVAYYDGVTREIRYAVFQQSNTELKAGEGSFTTEVVEAGNFGRSMKLALGSDGFARLVYYDEDQGDVRFLQRTPSGWLLLTIYSTDDIGFFTTMALTPLVDIPQVVYVNRTKNTLVYSKFENGQWTSEDILSAPNLAGPIQMTLDIGGRPYIGYMHFTYPDRFVYYIANSDESGWHSQPVVDERGEGIAGAFKVDKIGYIHFVYNNSSLLSYLRFNGQQWERFTLDLGPLDKWQVDLVMTSGEDLAATFWGGSDLKVMTTSGLSLLQDKPVQIPPKAPSTGGSALVSGGGAGCFVATAAFGSMASDSVRALTTGRDDVVLGSRVGQSLISLYYSVSPEAASAARTSETFRALLRSLISR